MCSVGFHLLTALRGCFWFLAVVCGVLTNTDEQVPLQVDSPGNVSPAVVYQGGRVALVSG